MTADQYALIIYLTGAAVVLVYLLVKWTIHYRRDADKVRRYLMIGAQNPVLFFVLSSLVLAAVWPAMVLGDVVSLLRSRYIDGCVRTPGAGHPRHDWEDDDDDDD